MFDWVIKGGLIYDGSGGNAFYADIGILGDSIAAMGDLQAECPTIDAVGLSVLPGFIDTHTHSDLILLRDPQRACAVTQGITTEVVGQDGLSYAPLSRSNLAESIRFLSGLGGTLEQREQDFSCVGEYLAKLHKKSAVNVVYQIPHGAIRLESLGFFDKPLTGIALQRALKLTRESFDEGAAAFSTGLSYFPCAYGDTDELLRFGEVCAEYDAPFVIHLRTVFRGEHYDPLGEAITIAKESGCRLHLSHFKTNPYRPDTVHELLSPIEEALSQKICITADTYAYPTGSTLTLCCLPSWAAEGGYVGVMHRLSHTKTRKLIAAEVNRFAPFVKRINRFCRVNGEEQYEGMTFGQVMVERGQSLGEMICDLLLKSGLELCHCTLPPEERETQYDDDVVELLRRPYYMICSDSIAVGSKPHPRTFGNFPRFLKLCLQRDLSLALFAQRACALPAATFGLARRGLIRSGFYADLVLLNEKTVSDNATYHDSCRYSRGIEWVMVNGVPTLSNGKITGRSPGYSLKRDRHR